jgi:hypothetical protein
VFVQGAAVLASPRGGAVSASLKKVTVLIVVAFLIFYLLTRPTEFANTLEDIAGWFSDAFDSIIRFFQALG